MQPLDGDARSVAARGQPLVPAERGLGDRLLEEAQHGLHQLALGRQSLLQVEHQQVRGGFGRQEPASHLWGQGRGQGSPPHSGGVRMAEPQSGWPGGRNRPLSCLPGPSFYMGMSLGSGTQFVQSTRSRQGPLWHPELTGLPQLTFKCQNPHLGHLPLGLALEVSPRPRG